MSLEKVSRENWTLGGLALLLALDLLFLPWFSISFGPIGIDLSGTDAPSGWLGVLAVLLLLALVADIAIESFSPQTTVPMVGGSRHMTRFYLAVAAALCVALKFLFNIHFSDFGFGFWAAVILTVALVYYAMNGRVGPARVRTPPLA